VVRMPCRPLGVGKRIARSEALPHDRSCFSWFFVLVAGGSNSFAPSPASSPSHRRVAAQGARISMMPCMRASFPMATSRQACVREPPASHPSALRGSLPSPLPPYPHHSTRPSQGWPCRLSDGRWQWALEHSPDPAHCSSSDCTHGSCLMHGYCDMGRRGQKSKSFIKRDGAFARHDPACITRRARSCSSCFLFSSRHSLPLRGQTSPTSPSLCVRTRPSMQRPPTAATRRT